MTNPDFRNRGLAAALINHIIEKYEKEYDFIYLFANATVLDFYPKFGFMKAVESTYTMDTAQIKRKESSFILSLIRKIIRTLIK
ncbi:MAG: GNAT family N-acetyltransferase [Clostridiaceae bacterium]